MLAHKLLQAAGNSAESKLYIDDVFSAYTYTGNGAAQTINNGIDLAGKGGMVWAKSRSNDSNHQLADTLRGAYALCSNSTSAQGVANIGFTSTGFNTPAGGGFNANGYTYTSWTFRRAPKFFDVVTWTGDGLAGRAIPHTLGITPGMVIVKKITGTPSYQDWFVVTNSGHNLALNLSGPNGYGSVFLSLGDANSIRVNGSTISDSRNPNAVGSTYIAYVFAHDTSADGIIQCGSFTTDGSGNATVTLGWEPQYLMTKSTATGSWYILDTARGWSQSSDPVLMAQSSSAENADFNFGNPTATGFSILPSIGVGTYIYLAIRRPNKPPTLGTQAFQAMLNAGASTTYALNSGIATDLFVTKPRNTYMSFARPLFIDRLRGSVKLSTALTDAEVATNAMKAFTNTGVLLVPEDGITYSSPYGAPYMTYHFKRAPGVFDQICTTGTGVSKTEAHGLTVAPELWLHKGRSGATQWVWGSSLLSNTEKIVMPTPAGKVTDATAWNSTYPTSSVISFGTSSAVNTSAATYTTYLWATLAGVSKVFGYTGDGSAGKIINCGFSTGARFILIVRTDTTGSVFIWDTVRGIIAGNDPRLCLDTTAAEVTTDDSIDPELSGFIINQLAATNINVNNATYIGLAFA